MFSGLPKPAIVSQLKVHAGRYMFRYCDASADDVLYEPLPLYHSAASILGVGSTINNGMFEAFLYHQISVVSEILLDSLLL